METVRHSPPQRTLRRRDNCLLLLSVVEEDEYPQGIDTSIYCRDRARLEDCYSAMFGNASRGKRIPLESALKEETNADRVPDVVAPSAGGVYGEYSLDPGFDEILRELAFPISDGHPFQLVTSNLLGDDACAD